MRYQERIYIQNANSSVRNKDILNVNMSSDICIFETPVFNLSGASKIDCGTITGTTYIVNTATTLSFDFQFIDNIESFSANSTTFKFDIYKYNNSLNSFVIPQVFSSGNINYSGFSGTNISTQIVPIDSLQIDGEYLIKGYYEYSNCTLFLNKLGRKTDTRGTINGYGNLSYDDRLDYHFIAIKEAEKPELIRNQSNTPLAGRLFQQVILPTVFEFDSELDPIPPTQNTLVVTNLYVGDIVVTMNGLVLAPNFDYTLSGNIVTLSGNVESDDIFTVIYTTAGGNNLTSDNIFISVPIVSGGTDNEGSNSAYFNTTTGKYEIYTSVTPSENGDDILVVLNGVTLANGIDYYQSLTNPKRIILEGIILEDDLIIIVYFPQTNVINGITTNTPLISWGVSTAPQSANGYFSLEVSSGTSFSNFYYSGLTNYNISDTLYYDSFTLTGSVGTQLYYRVKNTKNFETFCGDVIQSINYSDTIPITIQSNTINSY